MKSSDSLHQKSPSGLLTGNKVIPSLGVGLQNDSKQTSVDEAFGKYRKINVESTDNLNSAYAGPKNEFDN